MKNLTTTTILILFLIIPLASAAIEVTPNDRGSVIISELTNPAVFDFKITNTGPTNNIEILSLIGISFSPRGTFELPTGTTNVEVQAYLPKEMRTRTGPLIFEYLIKGQNGVEYKGNLKVEIVNLQDVLALETSSFKYEDKNITLTIKNTKNTNLNNALVTFRSEFFDTQQILSFAPFESKKIVIPLDTSKTKRLSAGKYLMSSTINVEGATAKINNILYYLEKQDVQVETSSSGLIVKQTTVTKTNKGNVPITETIVLKKDILSRLFTVYSIQPLTAHREGFIVTYTWTKDLNPNESWSVSVTTNYTIPFILLLLVIIVALLINQYTKSYVSLHKSVSYVKTKGGEFALKVRISVKSRAHVDNIQVIDRLPGLAKLYEKFGTKPDKIDSATRRLIWNIDSLQAGEERVFSYIIYSNLKVVGRYELPSATAVYEHKGKLLEAVSNKAFFMAETSPSGF